MSTVEDTRLSQPPPKEIEEFVALVRGAYAKTLAGHFLSRDVLSRPDALGGDWKLYSSMEYGEAKNDIRELLYIAQKPLLDLADKVEIVLTLKVFPNAGAAREWALERALAGAAPTEWKINLAKTYFCKAGSPGEFCFGPHLFVRGNVVVGFGSDIVPVVLERIDTSLRKLIPPPDHISQSGPRD